MKLTVVIPVFNEERSIIKTLDSVSAVSLPAAIKMEIVVVNDCSTDKTAESVKTFITENPLLDIHFFEHKINMGKGAAMHTGIAKATGDYLMVQDADLEYDPADYITLLQPIIDGKADVVYGSRFMGGKPHRILFFWHSLGNKFLTMVSNAFTNLNLSDMETGYKVFRADIIKNIVLEENRFGFEPEVTAKIARIPGIRIYEVGIAYYGRTYDEGKKITAKDGFRALYSILKYNVFDKYILPSLKQKYIWFFSLLILFFVGYKNHDIHKPAEADFLKWDAAEYYHYLPAVFIYHDLSFQFTDSLKQNHFKFMVGNTKQFPILHGRMSIGQSMLLSPFFLLAHAYANVFDYSCDGYSPPYQMAVLIGCLLFLFMGIFFLIKTLERYFGLFVSVISTLLIVLATNLFFYSLYEPGMTHTFTFGLVSLLIYFTDNYYRKPSYKTIIYIGLLMGIISLIRPSNAVVAIIFGLWNVSSWTEFKERIGFLFKNYLHVIIIAVSILLVWLPQMIYWHWLFGKFFFYTYGLKNEGFFFGNPQISNILFSYRKGWYIYTPLMFLATLGIIPMIGQRMKNWFLVLLYIAINVYILSSWWCWWYGGSYGARIFIDIYPIMAFPLAALILWIGRRGAWLIIPAILISGFLIQNNYYRMWQYNKNTVHYDSMTKTTFWESFHQKIPDSAYKYNLIKPNYDEAHLGVYYQNDKPAYTKKPPRDFLLELENKIRSSATWYQQSEQKASARGVPVDSVIAGDARWIFKTQYNSIVPE
ncbi:MAG: glycosyltransferase [Bacteroidales bacterium]|nr:glycosyltransferase [Bacteroidales bacterium]